MDFLNEIDARTLKAELLAFLEGKEELAEELVEFIKEDFSYA